MEIMILTSFVKRFEKYCMSTLLLLIYYIIICLIEGSEIKTGCTQGTSGHATIEKGENHRESK